MNTRHVWGLHFDLYLVPFIKKLHDKKTNCLRLAKNRIEQCFAAHIVQKCQQYSSTLLRLIQTGQCCSILLTTMNNADSKTLFNPGYFSN